MGDDELAAAYEATEFWVEDAPGGRFRICCDEGCPELDRLLADQGLAEWAYVTACNPGSELLAEDENDLRMRDLGQRLSGHACVTFRGSGVGTRGDWPPEPSLLVLGIDEASARKLGAEFGQKAMVVGRRGEPARLAWVY
jgi:hypothetical protein